MASRPADTDSLEQQISFTLPSPVAPKLEATRETKRWCEVNVSTLLLLLLVLACPVSMFFMHRGGGGHSHGSHDESQTPRAVPNSGRTGDEADQVHGGCGHSGHGAGSRHDRSKSGTPA